MKADLSDADLTDADLSDADLRGADLRGANLRRANLVEANIDEKCLETILRSNLEFAEFDDVVREKLADMLEKN